MPDIVGNQPGYTVSPVGTEDANGNITYSFDAQAHPDLQDDSHNQYVMDEFGNARSAYADIDTQQLQYEEPDYQRPMQQSDHNMQGFMTNEDTNFIMEQVGGAQNYQNLMQWSSQNLAPDIQQSFNELVHSGDVGTIQNVVRTMNEWYKQSQLSDSEYFDNNPQEYQQQEVPQYSYDANEMQNLVGGSERYQQLLQLAAENWSQEEIQEYDNVMNNGSPEDVATAVQYLASKFRDN